MGGARAPHPPGYASGEEKRTRFRIKKRKKGRKRKRKNLIAAKSGLVGMKGYDIFKTYNPVKYFCHI